MAGVRRHQLAHVSGGGGGAVHPRPGDGDVARRPLLQQQLARPHHRLGVKARAHGAAVQRVRDRDDRHALVVRHVHAHHLARLAGRQPLRRVVHRLVEPVLAVATRAARARKLRTASCGSNIAASAVAYGATTTSSPRPRRRPSPGTPKFEYWYVISRSRALYPDSDMPHGTPRSAP